MDIDSILAHHLLDHRIAYLFSIGSIPIYFTSHALMMLLAAGSIFVFALWAKRRSSLASVRMSNVLESVVLYIRDEMVRPNLGVHGDKYLPYFLTLFFFILLCNLIGMVPHYGRTATGNIAMTGGMALLTFLLINFSGIREHGLIHYIKSLIPHGLPWPLVPVMFCLEVLGLFTKALALSIRLFANMIAGHIAILVLISLIFLFKNILIAPISVAAAVAISMLEVFVCFLQAYVFTLLTALFVGAAVNPQH